MQRDLYIFHISQNTKSPTSESSLIHSRSFSLRFFYSLSLNPSNSIYNIDLLPFYLFSTQANLPVRIQNAEYKFVCDGSHAVFVKALNKCDHSVYLLFSSMHPFKCWPSIELFLFRCLSFFLFHSLRLFVCVCKPVRDGEKNNLQWNERTNKPTNIKIIEKRNWEVWCCASHNTPTITYV